MIVLGTKAETLQRLRPVLSKSYVLPLASFTVADWRKAPDAVSRMLRQLGPTLIVRSSARSEDSADGSRAGAFLSVADVTAATLGDAVERVMASYGTPTAEDQILVQPMLDNVRLSGVLGTRDLTTHAPYYVFDYDDRTGSTTSVTSGSTDVRTYVRFRAATEPFPRSELETIFSAAHEIERHCTVPVEMELALDALGNVCVFQVRPIATRPASPPPSEPVLADWLVKAGKKIEKLSRPHPHLHGTRSVFGVMPDWNPAEIIGTKPRALALTLYKEIITDSIWAFMRDNYGYRNLRSFPLMVSILGVPFIDVRVSFNSFIPKGVRDPLSEKLVNHYVDRLTSSTQSHDKVEFDIVFSCWYPGIRDDIARLSHHGFSGEEIGEILAALRELTGRIVSPSGLWRDDLAKLDTLKTRQADVMLSGMSSVDKIYWLLEDCKRWGTLPFCGLARAGFIAVQFLRGFVKLGILSKQDYEAYFLSLDTITNRIGDDVVRLRRGRLDRGAFMDRYGHLRPGTYDILSPRYDEDFDRYFGEEGAARPTPPETPTQRDFTLSAKQEREIAELLATEGLPLSARDVMTFIKSAIEGREYAKLVFTRSLSDALVELEKLGKQCSLTRDDLSHLSIRVVQELYSKLEALDLQDLLKREIAANKSAYETTRAVRLPDLILSPSDVFHFHMGQHEPNFITVGRVEADVIPEQRLGSDRLAGKAVFIRSADPGYDWIFSKGIAGLVTQFGGANSHMAIRAAEAGIPAVIGCGQRNFDTWSSAERLEIDCATRMVRVIR
jgi:glutamine kinase